MTEAEIETAVRELESDVKSAVKITLKDAGGDLGEFAKSISHDLGAIAKLPEKRRKAYLAEYSAQLGLIAEIHAIRAKKRALALLVKTLEKIVAKAAVAMAVAAV